MNIVLIVSDTFRRDHLGCYGNPWIHTPNLDRLAQRSVVFDHCYAGSFPTVPCRSDLMTGKYNFTYLGWAPLPPREATLARLLTKAGWLTGGIADTPFYVRNGFGYDRGFEDFVWIKGQGAGRSNADIIGQRRYEEDLFAPATMSAAEKWLEAHRKEQFFLLVDTWDPHEPWEAPDYYVKLYARDYDGAPSPWPIYWRWQEAGLSEEEVKLAHAHYCAEVTMVDRWVGRLLERIESLGLMDETAIIFTSDHGFYFGEHGIFGKGLYKSRYGYRTGASISHRGEYSYTFKDPTTGQITIGEADWYRSPLFDEVTRVPLLAYLPGVMARREKSLATVTDIMPTVLELAGVEIPSTVHAHSLAPLVYGNKISVQDFVVTSWPLHRTGQPLKVVDDIERPAIETMPSTVTDGEWTLIYATSNEAIELYHNTSDPRQESNVLEGNEAVARDLHARFIALLERVGTREDFLAPRRQFRADSAGLR